MPDEKKEVYQGLLEKYKARLEGELGDSVENIVAQQPSKTTDYLDFRRENTPQHITFYEKACNIAEKILNIKPDKKKAPVLAESIATAHLDITPTGAASLGLLVPLIIIFLGGLVAFMVFQSLMFVVIIFVLGAVVIQPLSNLPNYLAQYYRLKASNQMVLCIFYVVTYMRHTSNLENAIKFASEHLTPPLSLDMKKIVWDVETQNYDSLKDSLDAYLEHWREYNMEFVEAFHLIESSLLEAEDSRRLTSLDRALDVILEETYEKMLHYAHNLKSPITMLHMLGIILPILGLVILPLVVSFMDNVSWLHLLFFYNILLPVIVYFLGRSILSKRPTGYGETDISEELPGLKKYKNIIVKVGGAELKINPIFVSLLVGGTLFFIGITPVLLHMINPAFDMAFDQNQNFWLLEYITDPKDSSKVVGPFGIGASLLSLCIPLSFGLGFGIYYKLRSKNLVKIRKQTKELEDEFSSALFQLGNRLGDNIPAEMAFSRVAQYMQETNAGKFFRLVSINIQKMGMSVHQAIFHPTQGALGSFPSKIIESSMKVLVESIKKGPQIAAQALTNVARYIKEIHRVNERLRDLMADIISSMTSQIKFLTPAIAGIVIGITAMITSVLIDLQGGLQSITSGGVEGVDIDGGITDIFGIGIPTYFFQTVVGLYVVQIVYILTIMTNGIENGSDKLNERYQLGTNLINSTILYCLIACAVMMIFNFIAAEIISKSL